MSLSEKIKNYYVKNIKENRTCNLGVEIEHFITDAAGHAVPYAGRNGVCSILKKHMHTAVNAVPYYEGRSLIGFSSDDFSVSLEPGAQYEISIKAASGISEIEKIYKKATKNLEDIISGYGYSLVREGYQPVSHAEDIRLIPKKRYRLMDEYFRNTGTGGTEMMRGTASLQISIDYFSENDCIRKMRAAALMTPVIQLLTENTFRCEGRSRTDHLVRADIWSRTDPDRCGTVPDIFSENFGFESYADTVSHIPVILKHRNGITSTAGNKTAEEAYAGETLTDNDIRHILSMAFFDVRLKNIIEIRGADSLPPDLMLAYTALIKGTLYSEEFLNKCENFINENNIGTDDIIKAAKSISGQGFSGSVYDHPVSDAAEFLINSAETALPENERHYLIPLRYRLSREWHVISDYISLTERDIDVSRNAAEELRKSMECSPLYINGIYHGQTLAVPKIYSEKTLSVFENIVSVSYGIFLKVINEYLNCPDYRKLFPFSPELEKLILIPNGYDSLLPMARFDIFYHEDTGDFKFCEINTDGSTGMNEDRLHGDLILLNPMHQEIIRKYNMKQFELFDSWVETFLGLYGTFSGKKENPNVAIVDFLENGIIREFEEFTRRFQKAGVNCEICDIRSLVYENGHLMSPSGHRIDAIYRRAVTHDIMDRLEEVKPFIEAVRNGSVFLCGSFCTQIIHHKLLFVALHDKRTHEFLSSDEIDFINAHVPETRIFDSGHTDLDEVIRNKDSYILKPFDAYASSGVLAGIGCDEKTWQKKASELYGRNYICQEYCPQYATKNIDFGWGDGKWHNYINMPGLYSYNGKFAGIYSRLALEGGIIDSHRTEKSVPTFRLL